MAYIYKNITGSTAEILLSKSDLNNKFIKTMNLCNIHATDNVLVDLYLYQTVDSAILRSTGPDYEVNHDPEVSYTYYIIKSLKIPVGATLQLDRSDLPLVYENPSVNNEYIANSNPYVLYIKLNAADSAVDIIINQ